MKKNTGKYFEIGVMLAAAFLPVLIDALKPKPQQVMGSAAPLPIGRIALIGLVAYSAFIALTVFLVKIAWRYIL
jgi:hypothetical protein